MKLRQAIKEMDLAKDDAVFIHTYGKDDGGEPVAVSDISSTSLRKEVILVQPNHGGQEYGYRLYKFIVK